MNPTTILLLAVVILILILFSLDVTLFFVISNAIRELRPTIARLNGLLEQGETLIRSTHKGLERIELLVDVARERIQAAGAIQNEVMGVAEEARRLSKDAADLAERAKELGIIDRSAEAISSLNSTAAAINAIASKIDLMVSRSANIQGEVTDRLNTAKDWVDNKVGMATAIMEGFKAFKDALLKRDSSKEEKKDE